MQKLSKAINTDSIRPSVKPIVTHKSDNFEYKRFTLNTNNSQKPNLALIDSIKERQTASYNVSNFHEHHIYSSSKDLASSFSFSEDDQKYEEQKKLFSKFLLTTNSNCLNIIGDMNKINKEDMLTFVKIGDSQSAIQKNQIIAHFIGVWLQSMGYKDFQTKKKIIMNLQFIYPDEEEISEIATKLYDSLFHGFLPQYLQLKLLIELCKRGWQYFSFFVGKFIKIIRKFKKISQDQFIKEVQRYIQGQN